MQEDERRTELGGPVGRGQNSVSGYGSTSYSYRRPSSLSINPAKNTLAPLGIPVTDGEVVFGFTKDGGLLPILQSIDQINIHELSFFLVRAVFMTMIFRIGWLMDGMHAIAYLAKATTSGNASSLTSIGP